MSVLCSNDKGWVISHYDYTKKIYTNVLSHSGFIDLAYNQNLFNIITPLMRDEEAQNFFKNISVRTRKEFVFARDLQGSSNMDSDVFELLSINLAYSTLLKEARELHLFNTSPKQQDFLDNNRIARDFVDQFYNVTNITEKYSTFNGGNTNDYSIIVTINNVDNEENNYLIPGNCKFYCCQIEEINSKLSENIKYDFILLDPPWRNKFIRRKKSKNFKKSYSMLNNKIIEELPISNYLNEFGLIALWCTNSATHLEAIKQFFNKWSLDYVAEWYWLKITKNGEPVCKFVGNAGDKKPYERLIFGAVKGRPGKTPENGKVLISVPSAIHSHKPPLTEILAPYLPKDPKCLELFARYLLPGWTSVGNQVLTLQSLPLYSVITTENKNQ